jgi:hypothetical protein
MFLSSIGVFGEDLSQSKYNRLLPSDPSDELLIT